MATTKWHAASFAMVVSATMASGCCPRNPQAGTAVSAHGNTDWHIDTANEFLFGTDMSGNVTAANHAPGTWTRRHMHVGETNAAHFYADPGRSATGADKDATNGIDGAMLFFYAGHGAPTLWNTLGDNASQSSCLLGDCRDRTAGSRYYWQCSCEVFAHGPETCTGGGWAYGCPEGFDGSADSAAMRNVYERWGPALSKELRMACGASTSAYCHEAQANAIWDNFNNVGLDVADSFIQGLMIWGSVVPLCITTGGADVTTTPLYDTAFTSAANASGAYYHIQWGTSFAKQRRVPLLRIPDLLPVFGLRPYPLPDRLRGVKLERSGDLMVSKDGSAAEGYELRVNPKSGAVYLRGKRLSPAHGKPLTEEQAREASRRFLEARGMAEPAASEPEISAQMVASRPIEKGARSTPPMQKAVTYLVRRTVDVGGTPVPVIGDGGKIELFLNPDGSVYRMAKVWRQLGPAKRVVPVKPYETALVEARRTLGDAEPAYRLDSWDFGYQEADGNVDQQELRAAYHFAFVAVERGDGEKGVIGRPPRMVIVAAQK